MLADVLTYPVRKMGWMMILLGAVFSMVLDFFASVPVAGLAAGIFAAGYFGSFYLSIVGTTMGDRAELPEWPSFQGFLDDILYPFLSLLGLYLISFAPVFAVTYFMDDESSWFVAAFLAAVLYGSFYFSMAVLASLAFGNLAGALPHVVFPAIVRTFPFYLIIVVTQIVGLVVFALLVELASSVPYLGVFLASAVTLYLMMCHGRFIGLFYVRKRETIGWE